LGNRVAIAIKVNKILKSKNKVGENIHIACLRGKRVLFLVVGIFSRVILLRVKQKEAS
jgi:hypothetical protein